MKHHRSASFLETRPQSEVSKPFSLVKKKPAPKSFFKAGDWVLLQHLFIIKVRLLKYLEHLHQRLMQRILILISIFIFYFLEVIFLVTWSLQILNSDISLETGDWVKLKWPPCIKQEDRTHFVYKVCLHLPIHLLLHIIWFVFK